MSTTQPTPAPTPRTMEQIAQECAEKVCHEGCLLDRGVACELIATAIAQAVEQKDCKIANQAERIRYLEGATNHATGTPLSKAKAECAQAQAALAAKGREIADFNERINHTGEGNYLVHENAYLIDQKLAIEWACRAVNLPLSEWRSLLPAVEGLRARAEKAGAELAEARQIIRDHDAFSLARAQERDALRAEVERLKVELAATNATMDELKELKVEAIWAGINKDHEQQIAQLRAALAAAQEDTERLIKTSAALLNELDGEAFEIVGTARAEVLYEQAASVRAAIDAARRPQP